MVIEFNEIRAEMYNQALLKYPNARFEDLLVSENYLKPKDGERILGFGEGNGFFCETIAKALGKQGEYVICDASQNMLNNLLSRMELNNLTKIEIINSDAEDLELQNNYFDKIWSFGAFHHLNNQRKVIEKCYNILKPEGTLVICDVFQNSKLAKHFDNVVAKYCITGHEVKFLSKEYAESILESGGFKKENISIKPLNLKWHFGSKEDLGEFIYGLHALIKIPRKTKKEKIEFIVKGCEQILGIKKMGDKYLLNWPMKIIIAKK